MANYMAGPDRPPGDGTDGASQRKLHVRSAGWFSGYQA